MIEPAACESLPTHRPVTIPLLIPVSCHEVGHLARECRRSLKASANASTVEKKGRLISSYLVVKVSD